MEQQRQAGFGSSWTAATDTHYQQLQTHRTSSCSCMEQQSSQHTDSTRMRCIWALERAAEHFTDTTAASSGSCVTAADWALVGNGRTHTQLQHSRPSILWQGPGSIPQPTKQQATDGKCCCGLAFMPDTLEQSQPCFHIADVCAGVVLCDRVCRRRSVSAAWTLCLRSALSAQRTSRYVCARGGVHWTHGRERHNKLCDWGGGVKFLFPT
jgi:hypothetical protein